MRVLRFISVLYMYAISISLFARNFYRNDLACSGNDACKNVFLCFQEAMVLYLAPSHHKNAGRVRTSCWNHTSPWETQTIECFLNELHYQIGKLKKLLSDTTLYQFVTVVFVVTVLFALESTCVISMCSV